MKGELINMTRTWDKEEIRVPDGNRTHDLPPGPREVMVSIHVGDSDFCLCPALVMLINLPFIFHYRAQNSLSLFTCFFLF